MANAVMETGADAKRLLEIVKVISKYKVTQGISPEKLCDMFKELGPTFVKLGQLLSMHPEIIRPPVESGFQADHAVSIGRRVNRAGTRSRPA